MANADDLKAQAEKAVRDLGQSVSEDFSNLRQPGTVGASSTNALVAVIITIIFGPIGAFFCWWFFAQYGFLKSLIYTLAYLVGFVIAGFLCILLIGYLLLPLLYIYMVFKVYKAVLGAPIA